MPATAAAAPISRLARPRPCDRRSSPSDQPLRAAGPEPASGPAVAGSRNGGPGVFLTAFEPYSEVARKNPLGTIRAFREVAARNRNVHLVVKLNNAAADWEADPVLRRLAQASAGCDAISFLTDPFSYEQALGLYAAADVTVSLHRAEGIGFLPMQAMALGKPVIATGWSGNMAYLRHAVACLVDYRLVPLDAPGAQGSSRSCARSRRIGICSARPPKRSGSACARSPQCRSARRPGAGPRPPRSWS